MQSRWMKRRNDNGQEERFYPITHADAVVDLDTKIQENVESVTDSLSSHIENTDVHFSPQERDKLNTIEEGANKTIVDTSLSSTSSNAIANKAVQSAIQILTDSKANKSDIPNKVSQLTNDSGYLTSSTTPVKSVNGKTGAVTLTSSDVGLGNVNNTSDANKPVSTAQAAAIKVVQDGLNDHTGNEDIHFTATERTKLAGIATGANKYTHPTSGVTAGTYKSVTVDANGHVTGGSNPTTLAGYGITDAEAKGTVSSHNTSTSAHNDIRLLISDVSTKLNNFLNVSDTTKDQLSEIIALIEENADDIESITSGKVNVSDIVNNLTTNVSNKPLSAAQGVAIKALIDSLQDALDTDKTNLTNHTGNTTVHITSTERTNWNDANSKKHSHSNKTVLDNTTASYTTAEQTKLSGIATGAEVNQNAFSNIKVGSTTVAADSKTDTVEFVGSNVTITPDATNDKITFAVANGTTSAVGIVKLTDSVSSTDTTTAATPKNVKAAYDLANTAKTNAETAQATADSKVGSVSLASGTNNGTLKLTVDGKATDNIAVKGLGSAAYTASTAYATSDHTHNYAGSSSVGGAANSANKINTDAGSSTQPVFFDGGIPKPTTYTLEKSVPSDAVFTDTVYTHPSYTAYQPTVAANLTPGFGDTFNVYRSRNDNTGHVTDVQSWTVTIPDAVATTSVNGLMESSDKLKLNFLNVIYGTCETAASVAEKVVTKSTNGKWALLAGSIVIVKFTNTNSANNPKLNVAGTGARSIIYNTAAITTSNLQYAGFVNRTAMYVYNGSAYVFLGWSFETNTDTKVQQNAAITTAGEYPVLLGYGTGTTSVTNTVNKTSTLTYNPNTKVLTAGSFVGDTFTGNLVGSADVAKTLDGLTSTIAELNHVDGVTSNIQTQLNSKANKNELNDLIDTELSDVVDGDSPDMSETIITNKFEEIDNRLASIENDINASIMRLSVI